MSVSLAKRKLVYRWLESLDHDELAGLCLSLMTEEEIDVEAVSLVP